MSGDRKDLFKHGEEFLQLFSRGAEFSKELLVENERLRASLAELEQEQVDASKSPEEWDKYREGLQSRLQDLEEECETVRMRLQQVEEENQQFAARYLECCPRQSLQHQSTWQAEHQWCLCLHQRHLLELFLRSECFLC